MRGRVGVRVGGQGQGQGCVRGDGALHRGIALEELRHYTAPQVERRRGCRGEGHGEEQRDPDEAGRDVRQAAAYVLARRGAQRGGEPREEPACEEVPIYYCGYLSPPPSYCG